MDKATPVQIFQGLNVSMALKNEGIRFVPIPVMDDEDFAKLLLGERLEKLRAFFNTDIYAGLPEAERIRLRHQARFMDGYAAILTERMAAFGAQRQG